MGAPFSAETVTEFVQEFVDGNRVEQRMVGSVARDGMGRVRRELPLGGAGGLRIVTITLPEEGVQYRLDDQKSLLAVADAAGSARSPCWSRPGDPSQWDDDRATHQFVVGRLEDGGTRTTFVIPAN